MVRSAELTDGRIVVGFFFRLLHKVGFTVLDVTFLNSVDVYFFFFFLFFIFTDDAAGRRTLLMLIFSLHNFFSTLHRVKRLLASSLSFGLSYICFTFSFQFICDSFFLYFVVFVQNCLIVLTKTRRIQKNCQKL